MKKRSKFSLSHYKLATMNMGMIVPVGLTEVLSGDTLQQATSAFIRVTPLAAPVMHPVHVSIHHWYVPLRLIWDDFESFITGGEDGLDDSVYPTVTAGSSGFAIGSLADYLGVPTGVASLEVSALPFRAYDLIYNEWYRDENLVDPLVISTESGKDTTTSMTLQAHAWKKDYFTAASPWPQKGPAVTVPVELGSSSSISLNITGNGSPTFNLGSKTGLTLNGSPNDKVGQASEHYATTWSAYPSKQDPSDESVTHTPASHVFQRPAVWQTSHDQCLGPSQTNLDQEQSNLDHYHLPSQDYKYSLAHQAQPVDANRQP